MPRGPKKQASFDAELVKIDERIANYRNKISELEAKKKDVLAQKEEADLKAISEFIKASGKSPKEVLEGLKSE